MKKIAFITGGSRGIGFGIARALAHAGFDLAINGMRPEEDVIEAIDQLKEIGVDVIYCRGNVASMEDHQRMLDEIKTRYDRLDVMVNNAGVAPKERIDILQATEESFDYVFKTNLQGPYFLTQKVANWMIKQKTEIADYQGCIINIGSISATVSNFTRGEYCISKAGVAMMTTLFASRLGAYDIPVYEVRPGVIKTDMTSVVQEKYQKLIDDGLFIQARWGMPEDVGKAVAALANGYFPYSTGQVIMVDGGMTIPRL